MGTTSSREGLIGPATRREEKEAVVRYTRIMGKRRTDANRGYMLLMDTD
jgi:hypothetical protein